jgi:hypothetical protein
MTSALGGYKKIYNKGLLNTPNQLVQNNPFNIQRPNINKNPNSPFNKPLPFPNKTIINR